MKERLTGVAEHLDESGHDEAELRRSLKQVADVNRFLGGTRAAIRAVESLLPGPGPGTILDVGCGSGDIDAALATHMAERGRDVRITAFDLHPQIIALAEERLRGTPGATLVRGNALALPFRDGAYDVAMMSLTLHHFEDDAPVQVLRELGRVARAVVINDLERNWQNYAGATLLAHTLWARNRLTRHDGPLSVKRAFTASELTSMARSAGLRDVRVRRRFFYRLVLTARSDAPAERSVV
jgi:ubiquinone/menaquinone biosynthesis C-methylase UbiE